MQTRAFLAALAAATIVLSAPAHAGQPGSRAPSTLDVAAVPAYPFELGGRAARSHGQPRAQRVAGHRAPYYGAREAGQATRRPFLSQANRSLVSTINAKLARWVRPSGQCGGATETLTTFYNSGHHTANGERFYPGGLTAASLHHPFGTMLTVTNPYTGRTVVVRVNDRGPYTIAKLDLAIGAARALGMRTSLYLCVSTSFAANQDEPSIRAPRRKIRLAHQ